ncbi:unnamed protein product [Pleuronectes platessa]|uniref:Uncharacterized protein n=1 Tax=Pleuronectes platessa TaxID=8262 RepID=A0A9N7VSU8_PLEPL|nr:unnamed protein product [Pleuronectes platessa]
MLWRPCPRSHRIHSRHSVDSGPAQAVSSPRTTWLHVTRADMIMPRESGARRAPRLLRDTDRWKNTSIQVKVWQSFRSPSIALCNAPFNAPCSPQLEMRIAHPGS